MAKNAPRMARPMWRGTISFGLVNIPVRLVPAVKDKDIHFHMLHDKDNSRLERKMICPVDHEEVTKEDTVKGYEVSPGQHVVIQNDELQALAPKASRTIEIMYFADVADIDPIFYSRPFYLVPEEGAGKSYNLFVEAMAKSKKIGVATFVMRNKEYSACLRVVDKVLCLQTMYFSDEVIRPKTVEPEQSRTKINDREVKMALQLIDSLSSKFEPDEIKDEYREKVIELVHKKAEGEEVAKQPEVEEETPKVKDLLSALEASLAQAKKRKLAPKPGIHLNGDAKTHKPYAHAHHN